MFTKSEADGALKKCGICKEPCSTCRKCYTEATTLTVNGQTVRYSKDGYCSEEKENLGEDPSAFFCTACKQNGFVPFHVDDLVTYEDYVVN
jgi:hypothetical protein